MSNEKLLVTSSLFSPILFKVWSVDQQQQVLLEWNLFEMQNLRFHLELLNQNLSFNRIRRGFI